MSPSAQVPPFRWRDIVNGHALVFLVGVCVAYLVLVVGLAQLLLAPTGKNGQYVVVLPPWAKVDRIFEMSTAVDGRVIGLNDTTNAYLLYVERHDAVDALHRAGAWLVLDPARVGGILGCNPSARGASGIKPAVPTR
ncbi:MAG: hypothetical protein K0Q76_3794 [Panacagrimonas sp.]|jgi:hypothetical protein|nr:hypothetical protein [Panacagrimonas sp.]MCC2658686.1 hypothetical protein [Panacagrimonas sp.]